MPTRMSSLLDKDDGISGKNRPQDVAWLASLSDYELDMLVSLKKLIIQRAQNVGHESIVDKFDLKMFRALGFVVMEYFKERLKDSKFASGIDASMLLDGCNLSDLIQDGSFATDDIGAVKRSQSKKRKTEQ